jgi:putative ABC transport system permease protein
MHDHRAAWQSAIYAVAPSVLPTDASRTPIPLDGFAVYGEFFPMLDVPFEYGSGWSASDDKRGMPVVVIGAAINRRLFGGVDSVGRTVGIAGRDYRVVGVMKPWNPQPIFFDVADTGGFGGNGPDLFLPFRAAIAANMENAGSTNCPKGRMPNAPGFAGLQASACTWIAYMAELDDAAAVRRYRQYLDGYAREQQRLGRYGWPPNNRLRDLRAWLDHEHVVPDDTRVSMLVALGLLLVCLLNTVGLLLARFLRRSGEIGVRRAMGASRGAICLQFLIEAAAIGALGGVLGLLLTGVGVLGAGLVLPAYLAGLAHVDAALLLLTVLVAVLATLLAGLYPALRASRVQPAWQLKTQ